jgi:hypothetical protein
LLILLEGGLCLACAKLLLHSIPFRLLRRTMGPQTSLPAQIANARDLAVMASIGSALRAIGRRVAPLQQCLPQAIAAHWMARWRHVPNTRIMTENLSVKDHSRLRKTDAHVAIEVDGQVMLMSESQGR